MSYEFHYLADDLVLILWRRVPNKADSEAYLKDLTDAIDNAPDKVYFFSDLRQGHLTDSHVLREMGRLTAHPKWGGGVALVESLSAEVFVRLFGRFVTPEMKDFIFDTVEDACARLERWKEGVTQGYDWATLIPDE